jgi:hypothetical protein
VRNRPWLWAIVGVLLLAVIAIGVLSLRAPQSGAPRPAPLPVGQPAPEAPQQMPAAASDQKKTVPHQGH